MTEEQEDQLRQKASPELSLLTDKEWSVIDGECCRVVQFEPFSHIIEGKIYGPKAIPYASITLECKKVQDTITGFITHKIDFTHLWMVFEERTVKEDEEVIIYWTVKHYKFPLKFISKYCSALFPKLWVLVCRKGHFEFIANPSWQPESGKRRSSREMLIPIVNLKPEVMK